MCARVCVCKQGAVGLINVNSNFATDSYILGQNTVISFTNDVNRYA